MYSFDVFDTLITRYTATPEGIFAIMQMHLGDEEYADISEYVRGSFPLLRVGAEKVARKTYATGEIEDVTLEQIYDILVLESQVTREQAKRLVNLEISTEISCVCGVSENIKRVKDLLSKGEKVILISDMYQSREVIRRMLLQADSAFENLPLYVSSDEEKKGKWTGNLFSLVHEKEEARYEEWIHIGDNPHSDEEKPKQLGITCELYKAEELLDIEKKYLENHEWDVQAQLMIGCARIARMLGNKKSAYDLGCAIGGIILYPYVDWLLKDAVQKSVNCLYFIARDGFILKEIADIIVAKKNYPIKTKYIYGSRLAWRIPDLQNMEEEVWNIYTHSYQDRILSSKDLADFLGIPEEEINCYLPAKVLQPQIVYTTKVTDLLVKRLLKTEEFLEKLKVCVAKKKENLLDYIRQEIDLSGERLAFVDLAGSGLTQECLGKIMQELQEEKIWNYFFRKDTEHAQYCKNHVFYPSSFPRFVLLEMMCRAPHGQTVGYSKTTDGTIKVNFSDVDAQAIKEHGVPDFIEGAKSFAGILGDVLELYGNGITLNSHMIMPYLKYIFETSDKQVMDYFGDIPNMLTGREKKVSLYAPKLTDQELRNIFWYRENEALEYYYTGSDIDYSIARCTDKQKEKVRKYKEKRNSRYGKICRKLHRLFSKKHKKNATIDTLYDLLGQRIAIYGAGKVGQAFYQRITGKIKVNKKRYHSDVVLWMDQNPPASPIMGMQISLPEEAAKGDYEQLVIAIKDKEVAEQVRKELIQRNVLDWKIWWLYEF